MQPLTKEQRDAITDILEQYLNHRLVAGLVDSISDRLADINENTEEKETELERMSKMLDNGLPV